MEALGLNLGYLLAFALSFGILFVVLRAWVYTPLLAMLEKRRTTIARGLEDARVAADARANAEVEANRIINEAQTRAAELVREATDRAGSVEQDIRNQAESDAVKARQAALEGLQGERDAMLSQLRGQVAALAIAATRKLLTENFDAQRQHALIDTFFSGVNQGQITQLSDAKLQAGKAAHVTSALPLTDAEQATVQSQLRARIGSDATVEFSVDPAILGGLVVRVGDQVIDGSYAAQLRDLDQSLR